MTMTPTGFQRVAAAFHAPRSAPEAQTYAAWPRARSWFVRCRRSGTPAKDYRQTKAPGKDPGAGMLRPWFCRRLTGLNLKFTPARTRLSLTVDFSESVPAPAAPLMVLFSVTLVRTKRYSALAVQFGANATSTPPPAVQPTLVDDGLQSVVVPVAVVTLPLSLALVKATPPVPNTRIRSNA